MGEKKIVPKEQLKESLPTVNNRGKAIITKEFGVNCAQPRVLCWMYI